MMSWLSPDGVMAFLAAIQIIGMLFIVFLYFKNPQEDAAKKDALLAQEVSFDRQATNQRFQDMQKQNGDAMTLAQNHVHTVDTKVETLNKVVAELSTAVTKLTTIIDERIPKKTI